MSKINESSSPNKEEKSSRLIIISKDRIQSAKNKVNFITLKDGDIQYTVQLSNDNLNKNGINNAVQTMKQQILMNSRSYGKLYEKQKLNNCIKNKNKSKTPIKEKKERSDFSKRKDNLIIETNRSYNLMKTTENNKNEYNDDNIKKLETLISCDSDNSKEKKKGKINNSKLNIKQISILKNNEKNNNFNNIKINDINVNKIEPIILNEKNDYNNININNFITNDNNDNTITFDTGNSYLNNKNNKKGIHFDKYKSEEIKQINSSVNKIYNNSTKNNIYIDKNNNQKSDIAAKSISEHEQDNKTKIVSKLILTSDKIINEINNDTEDNKENNGALRLATEYISDDPYIKEVNSDYISDSQTVKVEENDEYDEENNNNNIIYNNDYNNIKNIYNNNNNNDNINLNSSKGNKNIFGKIVDELDKKKLIDENIRKNLIFRDRKKSNSNIYKACSICEHLFPMTRLFLPECQVHFFCKRCSKSYYEEIIENGIKEMVCPFTKCKIQVDLEDLKKIISKEHFNILINNIKNIKETQNKFCFTKLKTYIDNENLELYTQKHVLDINSNKNLYNYNNVKGVYCPKCCTNSLFSKTNTFFYKCLNCECKRCKYCLKDFDERHMDSSFINHCKVYYRLDDEKKDLKLSYFYFLQLFFVFATYYLCFVGAFLLLRNLFFYLFDIKKKRYIFFYSLSYFFSIIIFIIIIPFIVLFYPYFPSILALLDF